MRDRARHAFEEEDARADGDTAGALGRPALVRKPARRLRVAIAMPGGFEFGGIGRMMLYATQAWASEAWASEGWAGASSSAEAPPEWSVIDPRGTGRAIWSPAMTARAVLELARNRPDLLHLNVAGRGSTLRKLALAEAAARLRIPTIVHLHDYDYARDLARRPAWLRRRISAMFCRAAQVIVLGQRDRATVERELGVPAERVTVLHNAVPDPGPPPARLQRKGPVQLVFLGHLDDRKGVPELLDALADPALRALDWRLVMAGGGEIDRFAQVARTSGLAERITFTGWLPHDRVYALCREADVFVLPSHAEGQAMSLLEAMAHGLAIVTTPVGAHLEAIEPEREALIVPPGDVGALTTALARLIDNAPLRDTLGTAARQKYCGNFNAVQYSRTLLGIYGRVSREKN
jgi:glycosyltransferase involved in cell wall biosynthesis